MRPRRGGRCPPTSPRSHQKPLFARPAWSGRPLPEWGLAVGARRRDLWQIGGFGSGPVLLRFTSAGTFPLSGVVLRDGSRLVEQGTRILQSHTYAGANSLAFLTAAEVLREVPKWEKRVQELAGLVKERCDPAHPC